MPELTMGQADAERLATALHVLAEPTRLRILTYLSRVNGYPTGKDVQQAVGHLAQPTVSHHVRLLVDAGYVEQHKVGVFVHHGITAAGRDALEAVRLVPRGEPDA